MAAKAVTSGAGGSVSCIAAGVSDAVAQGTAQPEQPLSEEGLPRALVVSGAGSSVVNGIYVAALTEYCGALLYEHVDWPAEIKITREPHTNVKSGRIKHGWLIGRSCAPQYGVPTEDFTVPQRGWRVFGGTGPSPEVQGFACARDACFSAADAARAAGDRLLKREEWTDASALFARGLEALRRCPAAHNAGADEDYPWAEDADFAERAGQLLSRRARVSCALGEPTAALRDSIAGLDLLRSLPSAELVAREAAAALGFDHAATSRLLGAVGGCRLVDPLKPLALGCVERWLEAALRAVNAESALDLPEAVHDETETYFDGVDATARQRFLERHVPGAAAAARARDCDGGGSGTIGSAAECLALMRRWEVVFATDAFQEELAALWDCKGLSYPLRLQRTQDLVARSLAPVLGPLGYAAGRPGLARVVQQMRQFWSVDIDCARKAQDLEELAEVSLADLDES